MQYCIIIVKESLFLPASQHHLQYLSFLSAVFQARLSVLLDIPRDGYFRIMIGYSLKISDSAEADVQLISSSDRTIINSTSTTFSKCTANCYHRLSPPFLHLSKGKVRVVVNSTQDDLKLVSAAHFILIS